MLHYFLLFCLLALCVWLFRQLPGFRQPVQPMVILVLFLLALALLAWFWVGEPRITSGWSKRGAANARVDSRPTMKTASWLFVG